MPYPPDRDAAHRRLLTALLAEPNAGDHQAAQDRLPEFAEAELAGQNAAALFPDVQAHLDACDDCSQLYAELLDMLLAEESGEFGAAAPAPAGWPASLLLRRTVRAVAAGIFAQLSLSQSELERALANVFDDHLPQMVRGHLLAEPAADYATAREAAQVVAAAYNATTILTAASPASLLAEQSHGGVPALVHNVTLAQAHHVHMNVEVTASFVTAASQQLEEHYSELVGLSREKQRSP
jgi:hypothetical protein